MDDGVLIGWVHKEFTLVLHAFVLLDVELDTGLKLNLLALVEQAIVILTLLDLVNFGECPAVLSLGFWGQHVMSMNPKILALQKKFMMRFHAHNSQTPPKINEKPSEPSPSL